MDFLGGPGDGLIGVDVGGPGVGNAFGEGPGGGSDLDWFVGFAGGGSGGFEVDGGECGLVDHLWMSCLFVGIESM